MGKVLGRVGMAVDIDVPGLLTCCMIKVDIEVDWGMAFYATIRKETGIKYNL